MGEEEMTPNLLSSLEGLLSIPWLFGPKFYEKPDWLDADDWDETNTHEQGRRIVQCVNALSGIADPEQFMADVRELVGNAAATDCKEFTMSGRAPCGFCVVCLRARLAAQLKGGE